MVKIYTNFKFNYISVDNLCLSHCPNRALEIAYIIRNDIIYDDEKIDNSPCILFYRFKNYLNKKHLTNMIFFILGLPFNSAKHGYV